MDNVIEILQKGKTILYPTETVWGIGCDATNPEAVSQIYTLKQRKESKALICLVSDFNMLENYVSHVPSEVYSILKSTNKPTTIIYQNSKNLAPNCIAQDNTIAIRVTTDPFCKTLISEFGKPIVSTSANIAGQPTPKSFKEISNHILKGVDYIVNLHNDFPNSLPSRIIIITTDGTIKIIRD